MNKIVKILSVAALAVVFFAAIPSVSFANEGGSKKLLDDQVSVQYLGVNNDNVVFRVKFANPTADKFWLIIKNDAGDIVYRKQFSDVNFEKSVSLQRDAAEIHPTFVIRNGANEVVRQFSVTNTITENTIITEL
jgi:hypothetical protein